MLVLSLKKTQTSFEVTTIDTELHPGQAILDSRNINDIFITLNGKEHNLLDLIKTIGVQND